ncbi:MAG: hypothetical protein QM831_25310 [Kofleriaceae bacterium]
MGGELLTIDGRSFSTVDGLFDTLNRVVLPRWQPEKPADLRELERLLGSGHGRHPGDVILRWRNSELSRAQLGYAEMVRYLEARLAVCPPHHVDHIHEELALARRGDGLTMFEEIVAMFERQGDGFDTPETWIYLELC